MKSISTLVFALFSISTLFYNCSPVPITKMSLANDDIGYWKKGTSIGEKMVDSLIVEAVYSHSDKRFVYYDLAFENVGNDRATISPKEFRLIDPINGGILKAIDPELMILNMEIKNSKRAANNKTLAIVAGAALVAGTVAAISTSDDGQEGSSSNEDNDIYVDTYVYTDFSGGNSLGANYHFFNQEPLLSTDCRNLPSPKNVIFWKEFAFRKTTLFPQERRRGLVAFLKSKYMKDTRLIIPSEPSDITFDFIHLEYRP